MHYQQEIEHLKQSVARYRQENQALAAQLQAEQLAAASGSSSATLAATDVPAAMQAVATRIDQELNFVLSGQVEVYQQQALLERYNATTQAMLGAIAQQLNPQQLSLSNTLLEALDAEMLAEPEMQQIAAILAQRLPALTPAPTDVVKLINDPGLETKHKRLS